MRPGRSRTTCCTPTTSGASQHRFVPSAVFTRPQIATVGLTEAQARHQVAQRRRYRHRRAGLRLDGVRLGHGGHQPAWCKLIADPETGLLLGAHILGHEASLFIQPLIQAMNFGLDVDEHGQGSVLDPPRADRSRGECTAGTEDRPGASHRALGDPSALGPSPNVGKPLLAFIDSFPSARLMVKRR